MQQQLKHQLKIGGMTPFTATDYPGQLAAVIFVQGCPWRCTYCHNPHLQERHAKSGLAWSDVLSFLKRRIGLIDAVVFSGGEPTMDSALSHAISEVRQLGFKIGLHTACIYPRQLQAILPLVDWVGFDVKAPIASYSKITGVLDSGKNIRQCVEMIINSGISYECRTTLHPTLLTDEELLHLTSDLKKLGVTHYAIQIFRAQGCANETLNGAIKKTPLAHYPNTQILNQMRNLFPHFVLRRDA